MGIHHRVGGTWPGRKPGRYRMLLAAAFLPGGRDRHGEAPVRSRCAAASLILGAGAASGFPTGAPMGPRPLQRRPSRRCNDRTARRPRASVRLPQDQRPGWTRGTFALLWQGLVFWPQRPPWVSLAAGQRGELVDTRVEDVMTTDVATVLETAGYKEIIDVMRRRRVSAVPVLDAAGQLAGVVSEADLLLKEVGVNALGGYLISTGRRGEQAKAAGVTAAELMSTPAATIGRRDSVAAAARRMHERRVKRLVVVDDAGHLAGIVSRVDVLSVFTRPDDEIRHEVVSKIIAADFALDPGSFGVTVSSGIVTVTGQAESRTVAAQLADALGHVEGVVDVRNRLTVPPAEDGAVRGFLRPRPPG